MTDKLAVIIATKPAPWPEHVQAQGERWLLEEFNTTLMNNASHVGYEDGAFPVNPWDYPDAKFIAPIFGYKESWNKAHDTWSEMFVETAGFQGGNVYYYNCGGTIDGESWNGLDEPGTRGPAIVRTLNYWQAKAELRCVKAFLPGLKTVVAHPWPVNEPEGDWLMNMDVAAWRLSLMEQHMAQYADRLAQVPELWAYLIDTDFERIVYEDGIEYHGVVSQGKQMEWARGIGPRVRAVGATTLLINDVSLLPYLFNAETRRPTDVGKALLKGCKEA